MDWQIRVSLIFFGIALVGYIYFDYSKKKKIENKNEKLKRQFSQVSAGADGAGPDGIGLDGAGFDSNGVGKPRSKNQSDSINVLDKIEPRMGELNVGIDKPTAFEPKKLKEPKEPKVYSLIIQAQESCVYKGHDFMPLFLSQGLKYGEMNIFHRYQHMGKNPGDPIFSLANAVEPGTFDLAEIDSFATPAFAIFSTFSGQTEYLSYYKNLVKTAEFLVKELGGKLLDKSGNVYTQEVHKERLEEINAVIG